MVLCLSYQLVRNLRTFFLFAFLHILSINRWTVRKFFTSVLPSLYFICQTCWGGLCGIFGVKLLTQMCTPHWGMCQVAAGHHCWLPPEWWRRCLVYCNIIDTSWFDFNDAAVTVYPPPPSLKVKPVKSALWGEWKQMFNYKSTKLPSRSLWLLTFRESTRSSTRKRRLIFFRAWLM